LSRIASAFRAPCLRNSYLLCRFAGCAATPAPCGAGNVEPAIKRVEAIVQGDPLDPATMLGAQAPSEQMEKILSYFDIGRQEGAEVLTGGERNLLPDDLAGGYYVKPTVLRGHNKMRVFQEEIFGRSFRSPPSTTTRRSASPTTRSTALAPASGPVMARVPTAPAGRSRPAGCGPTATTRIRRTRHSVATSSPASGARTTR